MAPNVTLTLVDGVKIVVPDSLELLTPYVLREQQDWFEDEIKFLRRLLQPGQQVIDIGANYGVYTHSMARKVGANGRVWAFEPATSTARLLEEASALNGFAQTVVERSALSNRCGTAWLSLNENAEMNSLGGKRSASAPGEMVPLVTLDACLERHGWRNIDFVKMDAEGEEANILDGGRRFFAELSPLVQYEVRHVSKIHLELVQKFSALGYQSYRLVPGLDLLAPFDATATPDEYLINLFCCKRERAAQLAAAGFLLDSAATDDATAVARFADILDSPQEREAYDWRCRLATLPYGGRLVERWTATLAAGGGAEVSEALSLYAYSHDVTRSPADRFRALKSSFGLFYKSCEQQPSYLRLASFARVAREYGARLLAVRALEYLSNNFSRNERPDLSEPFLAPCERFDALPPGIDIADWVLAAVLEELELLGYLSSFFTGNAARPRLEIIHSLGFGSAEMERRLHLLQRRFGAAN